MNTLLSRTELITVLEKIIITQNEGEWTILKSLVQPTVLINGDSQQRSEFIADSRSHAQSGISSKLDSYVVDTNAQAIAARIIKSETASSTEESQYQEIILAWFVNGRLSNLKRLRDNDARRAKQTSVTATSPLLQEAKPTSIDLDALYRAYIKSINDQTMEANFETFCKPVVSHNAVEKTVAEYIALIQESQSAIQGLYFEIQDLIVDSDSGRVAARLEFTGVPVKRWADADATGDSVKFHEHVMYWFDEGRMHWVWSIVDLDAYRKQLHVKI
ncbi:Ff.00g053790.m01.CDS01 [Fusarium sp. VM40]|nr:Ff.00g053790.m01.CDS01 [Fusarium sp. VM40]